MMYEYIYVIEKNQLASKSPVVGVTIGEGLWKGMAVVILAGVLVVAVWLKVVGRAFSDNMYNITASIRIFLKSRYYRFI